MKKINLIVSSVLLALLAGGCADKSNVAYDDSANQNNTAAQEQYTNDSSTTDTMTKNTSSSSMTEDRLGYINVVTSNVNGQDVALRSVHFEFDKYKLTDVMRAIEKENYEIISPIVEQNKGLKIKLEGNCDEWGSDEYNYALGLKRAKAVKDTLVNDGISADKITLVSLGESNPVCTDKTQDCWKKNRRVDHKLLP